MLVIEPIGGLANRMRVIASGFEISKILNQPLRCIWILDSNLGASFEDLFMPIRNNVIINTDKYDGLRSSLNQNVVKKYLITILNRFQGINYCLYDNDIEVHFKNDQDKFLTALDGKKNIYIETCTTLPVFQMNFDIFRPIPKIAQEIDRISNKFNSNTIGVHIRRTDNDLSIKNSPTQLFIEHIFKEIETNPLANFFLATDDSELSEYFTSKFGEKIICFPKIYERESRIGIQHAVIDLFCLSKTKIIWGSYWSSFSEVAAYIGNNNLFLIKATNA